MRHYSWSSTQITPTTGTPLSYDTSYRILVRQLNYLNITLPDLSYPVHILSQFMAKPTDAHRDAAIKLLRYLRNALRQYFVLTIDSSLSLQVYCDAELGLILNTKRLLSGYYVMLGKILLSSKCKK